MDVATVTLAAIGVSLAAIGVALGGVSVCLRRQPPIPPDSPDLPEHPSGPFGWHVCGRMKAWFGLLTGAVLVLILAVGVLVVEVAEDEPMIDIVSHRSGEVVEQVELVRGNSEHLEAGDWVWLVVCPQDTRLYYPQAEVYRIEPGGAWSTYALIGAADDSDRAYDLLAVRADDAANVVLRAHMSDADAGTVGAPLAELPDGAKIFDRVPVIRQ